MKLKNQSRVGLVVNLATTPPSSAHFSPKEIKVLRKEIVETSSEVVNLMKKNILVEVTTEVKPEPESSASQKKKKKKGG